MKESRHYAEFRKERQDIIEKIGIGNVVHITEEYDQKRGRMFRYEITDNAILIVKSIENDFIITKMVARPSRIRKYWKDVPEEIIEIAVKHHKENLYI